MHCCNINKSRRGDFFWFTWYIAHCTVNVLNSNILLRYNYKVKHCYKLSVCWLQVASSYIYLWQKANITLVG